MTCSSFMSKAFCILTGFIILCGVQGNIQLFRHINFTGLTWESNNTVGCNNIPSTNWEDVYSIRTNKCSIAYFHPDCKSPWSVKFLPGNIDLSKNRLVRAYRIKSILNCNEEEGGFKLDIDITAIDWRNDVSTPKVFESYKNVCSCIHVPHYVQNMDMWSIDNHHNDLLAYYEYGCSESTWNSTFIPAGQNLDSKLMDIHRKFDQNTMTTYYIQSLGPDPKSSYFQTSCNSSRFNTQSLGTYEDGTPESENDVIVDNNLINIFIESLHD